jgi:uncharacterized protein (TIGR03435 family)
MSQRGLASVAAVLALALTLSDQAAWAGQSAPAAPRLRFDAASVKPTPKNSPLGEISTWQFFPNGDVQFGNATLHLIITLAFSNDIRFSDRLLLGTQPVLQERFDIQAKAAGENSVQARQQRLQALLEERFKLRTHTETREIPVYALTLVRPERLGRDLHQTEVDCTAFDFDKEETKSLAAACGQSIRRDAAKARLRESGPMTLLVRRLASAFTDRPLIDQTGLTGLFAWDVTFRVDTNPAVDSEFLSVEAALADQLGLKLVPQRAPREVRIIDHVEPPTEN